MNTNTNFNKLNTIAEPTWVTADNERIPFSKVTHQHWSNIYWYHTIFERIFLSHKRTMQQNAELAMNKIRVNFNAELLDWKPVFDFEITWLNELGLIKEDIEIVGFDGKKIGNILTVPVRKTNIQ